MLEPTLDCPFQLEHLLESRRSHRVGELQIVLGFGAGDVNNIGLQVEVVCVASPEQIDVCSQICKKSVTFSYNVEGSIRFEITTLARAAYFADWRTLLDAGNGPD